MSDPNPYYAGSPPADDGVETTSPPVIVSPNTRILRRVALIGTGVLLLWKATSLARITSNQGRGFIVLTLALVAVGLTCFLVLPAATRRLRRRPDLLVPLGLYLVAEALLSLLLTAPVISSVFSPAWNLRILSFSMSLSLGFLAQIALAVTYAGWTTTLVLQEVHQDQVDPLAALSAWPAWFWRVLAAEVLGWCVLFAFLIPAIALGAVVLPLTLLLIGAFSLFWNLITAPLLPVVVAERGPLVVVVRQALRLGWRRMGRWWIPVVLQMILLGAVTLLYVTYSRATPGGFATTSKSDVSVNGFWTGGYENACRWHAKLMAMVETPPLPLIEFLLGVAFAILAIVVKLRIAADLYGPAPAIAESSVNPFVEF